MFDCFPKRSLLPVKKKNKLLHNFIQFYMILKMLPCVCFQFLRWVKFCWLFQTGFFSFGRQKKWLLVALGRWSSYTVMVVWEFARVDSALVVLDEWSSYRGGRLNRFDCISTYILSCKVKKKKKEEINISTYQL